MTELIGLCILISTAWLSLKYHPVGRDSFLLMGLCLFCGIIVLLSGVDSLNVMSIVISGLGAILVVLYRGQLRVQHGTGENTKESLPVLREEEQHHGKHQAVVQQDHKNFVA